MPTTPLPKYDVRNNCVNNKWLSALKQMSVQLAALFSH